MLAKVGQWLVHRRGRIRAGSLLLAVVVAITAAAAWPTSARKRARAMPFEEVATTWVGLSTDESYLVRIVLQTDRSGIGGYTFLDEEPRVFRISSWGYDAGKIKIKPVPPVGPPTWVSPMQGSVQGVTMHLEASEDDWKVLITLRREAELEQRWKLLKRQMEENR